MIDHDDIDRLNEAARLRRERVAAIPSPADIARARAPSEVVHEHDVQNAINRAMSQIRTSPEMAARVHGARGALKEAAQRLTTRGWTCDVNEDMAVMTVRAPSVTP